MMTSIDSGDVARHRHHRLLPVHRRGRWRLPVERDRLRRLDDGGPVFTERRCLDRHQLVRVVVEVPTSSSTRCSDSSSHCAWSPTAVKPRALRRDSHRVLTFLADTSAAACVTMVTSQHRRGSDEQAHCRCSSQCQSSRRRRRLCHRCDRHCGCADRSAGHDRAGDRQAEIPTHGSARRSSPCSTAGTLTQAQIDAVVKALQDARPAGKGPKGGDLRGGPGRGVSLSTAATALGATEDEVRAALQGGQSLADLAKAKGVDPQKVIDALLAPIVEHEKADGRERQGHAGRIGQADRRRDHPHHRLRERQGTGQGHRRAPRRSRPQGPLAAASTGGAGHDDPRQLTPLKGPPGPLADQRTFNWRGPRNTVP